MCVYFWTVRFVLLMLPNFILMPHCFFNSLALSQFLKSGSVSSPVFFFKVVLVILDHLYFHWNFKFCFRIFMEKTLAANKPCWHFDWIAH